MSEAKTSILPGFERYVRVEASQPFDLGVLWRLLEAEFIAPYVGVAMHGLQRLCGEAGATDEAFRERVAASTSVETRGGVPRGPDLDSSAGEWF